MNYLFGLYSQFMFGRQTLNWNILSGITGVENDSADIGLFLKKEFKYVLILIQVRCVNAHLICDKYF